MRRAADVDWICLIVHVEADRDVLIRRDSREVPVAFVDVAIGRGKQLAHRIPCTALWTPCGPPCLEVDALDFAAAQIVVGMSGEMHGIAEGLPVVGSDPSAAWGGDVDDLRRSGERDRCRDDVRNLDLDSSGEDVGAKRSVGASGKDIDAPDVRLIRIREVEGVVSFVFQRDPGMSQRQL